MLFADVLVVGGGGGVVVVVVGTYATPHTLCH